MSTHSAQNSYTQPQRPVTPTVPERRPVTLLTVEPTTSTALQENSAQEFDAGMTGQEDSGFPVALDLQAEKERQRLAINGGQLAPEGQSDHHHTIFESPNTHVSMDMLRSAPEPGQEIVNLDTLDASHPLSNNNPENQQTNSVVESVETSTSSVSEEARKYSQYLDDMKHREVIQQHEAKQGETSHQAGSAEDAESLNLGEPSNVVKITRFISPARLDDANEARRYFEERQEGMAA